MAWTDWIERYLAYTAPMPSPAIFREWSAIGAIAGALERRVYVKTGMSLVYPNLYTLLVATPGIGKTQGIFTTNELWYSIKDLKVAPDNVTRASLVDALAKAQRTLILADAKVIEYHALAVAADEFGVLVSAHDLDFLSIMNKIYDNPRTYRETRRTGNRELDIIHPQMNILAGVQPGYLASLLPEEAWSMGFTSRLIMIYASSGPIVELFEEMPLPEAQFKDLREDMMLMAKMTGACKWTDDAKEAMSKWHRAKCPPIPTHSKLQHYATRRTLHTLKLCMIAAISRSGDLVIELQDFHRAQDWLLAAEQLMPDIFREMVGKSDGQVIQDLHYFMFQLYIKEKKPLHQSRIVHFLQARMPSDKILRLIDIAERSQIIQRVAGTEDQYIPRPRNEWGNE